MIISSNFTLINFPIILKQSFNNNEHVALSKYFYNIVVNQWVHPCIIIPEHYILFYALPNNNNEFTLYCIRYNTTTYVLEYMIDCKRTYMWM